MAKNPRFSGRKSKSLSRAEAVQAFVQDNFSILSSASWNKSIQKDLKKKFVQSNDLASQSIFREKEVADEVVRIGSRGMDKENLDAMVDSLLRMPLVAAWFSADSLQAFVLTENLAKPASILSGDEFSKIHRETHLVAVEAELTERAKRRASEDVEQEYAALKEREREVQAKEEQVRSLQSSLEQEPKVLEFPEDPAEESVGAVEQEHEFWWESLGLEKDPFPTEHGLDGFEEEEYEGVLVPTAFLTKYSRIAEERPEWFIGKTIALLGEYGSGKTTVFDALTWKLGNRRAITVQVPLDPSPNPQGLMREMYQLIGDAMCSAIAFKTGENPRSAIGPIDDKVKLAEVAKEFVGQINRPLIAFVDGLHKGNQFPTATWQFLASVQNLQEMLSRNKVEVGILVAGSDTWGVNMRQSPLLSGSISEIIEIPDVEEADAVDAVIRRVTHFSKPELLPHIRRTAIKHSFQIYAQRSQSVGRPNFRGFLSHIRKRLVVGDFKEVGVEVSPYIEAHEDVLAHIRGGPFAQPLMELVTEASGHPKAQRKYREVLQQALGSGLKERTSMFHGAKPLIQRLRNGKLIDYHMPRGFDEPAWFLSRGFAEYVESASKELDLRPIAFIKSIFVDVEQAAESEADSIYGPLMQRSGVVDLLAKEQWPLVYDKWRSCHSAIQELSRIVARSTVDDSIPGLLNRSLVNSLEVLRHVAEESTATEDVRLWFESAWIAPENSERVLQLLTSRIVLEDYDGPSKLLGLLNEHADVLAQVIEAIEDCMRGETMVSVRSGRLARQDRLALHRMRRLYAKNELPAAIREISEHIEEKIKDVMYYVLRAIFGDDLDSNLPPLVQHAREKVQRRSKASLRTTAASNFFYDLSRSEHPEVLFFPAIDEALQGRKRAPFEIELAKKPFGDLFRFANSKKHGEKKHVYRERSDDITRTLADAGRMCSILNEFLLAAIEKGGFETNADSTVGSVRGRFVAFSSSKVIELRHSEADYAILEMLRYLSAGEGAKDLLPLKYLLVSTRISPECQMALLQGMIEQELVELTPGLQVRLTKGGEANLAALEKKVQSQMKL